MSKAHRPNSTQQREADRLTAAIDRANRCERRMVRAFNAWTKARKQLLAMEARLDKRTLAGAYDVRQLADLDDTDKL